MCEKCGSENVVIIQETEGTVESNGLLKVICTWVICLPWGVYTLMKNKDTRTTINYKYCKDCGHKEKI